MHTIIWKYVHPKNRFDYTYILTPLKVVRQVYTRNHTKNIHILFYMSLWHWYLLSKGSGYNIFGYFYILPEKVISFCFICFSRIPCCVDSFKMLSILPPVQDSWHGNSISTLSIRLYIKLAISGGSLTLSVQHSCHPWRDVTQKDL